MMPLKNTFLDVPATRGSVTFRPTFTGQVLGDFLLGYVADAQLSNIAETHQLLSAYAFYVQDDWKPSSKLTVNAGLRYDFMTPPTKRTITCPTSTAWTASVQAKDGSLADARW